MAAKPLAQAFAAAIAAAALAGCGARSVTAPPVPPVQQNSSAERTLVAGPNSGPPDCKHQKTTSQYASKSEILLTSGGKLCIPAFGGLGGSLKYPSANPSVGITLISSTTNYNGKLPSLHSGTPVFYLQLATSGGTDFGSNLPGGGGVTGASIQAGNAYTIYGQAVIEGFPVNLTPCYTTATTGKFGGVIGGTGSLLKGVNVPSSAQAVIEIYPGQSTSGHC